MAVIFFSYCFCSEITASQEYVDQQSDEILKQTKLGIDSCIETMKKVLSGSAFVTIWS